MSYNTQNPYFWTLDGNAIPSTLEVVGATYISIYTETSPAQITNTITGQFMTIPANCVMELSPDSGNTLQTLQIYPDSTNFVYITMFGGVAQLI